MSIARKHTGKVAQKEVDGVNGRPAKKLKLEQEEEEKDVEDKGKKVKVGEKIAKKEKAGEEKVKAGEEKAKKKKAGEETAKKVKAGEEKAKKEKTVEETANNENAGEQKKVEEMEDDLDHGVSDEEAMEISEEQPSKGALDKSYHTVIHTFAWDVLYCTDMGGDMTVVDSCFCR